MAVATATATATGQVVRTAEGTWSQGYFGSPVVLLFLNLMDAVFTLCFLQLGLAEEANPLMRVAYEHSPIAFMGLKLAVVHTGVILLWAHRASRAARAAMGAGNFFYSAIVAYHLAFLLSLTLV